MKFIVFNPNQDLATQPLRLQLTVNRADQSAYVISSADKSISRSTRTLDIQADHTLKTGTSLILPVEFGFQYIPDRNTPTSQPWISIQPSSSQHPPMAHYPPMAWKP
ncbi:MULTISPECIES: hypothetical protein [unclassified Synechococcus]|uniref:hypothetical protein n=1 Tax=unclassified Synechococcus TaxID=2626047 RepID=UPI0021A90038|nr:MULTISPECIES: hypothetical protein [unclassified Synechococcus]MCT0212748.1 hypothetical protein [Synechococcus sp. CS-1326]MCT0232579.1 hypothetical protein [Synechococcus sp. CS-1327]